MTEVSGWLSSCAAAPASSTATACFSETASFSCAEASRSSMCRRSRRSEKMPTVAISRPSSSKTSAAEIETGTRSPAAAEQIAAHRLEPPAAAVLGRADEAHDLLRRPPADRAAAPTSCPMTSAAL